MCQTKNEMGSVKLADGRLIVTPVTIGNDANTTQECQHIYYSYNRLYCIIVTLKKELHYSISTLYPLLTLYLCAWLAWSLD